MKNILAIALTLITLLTGCSQKPEADPNYVKEINEWDAKRVSRLKADDGWLNLIERFWLKPGENTFGTSKDNDIVIESSKLPEHIGSFLFVDTTVTFKANEGTDVLFNNKPVKEIVLIGDEKKDMTVLQIGSVKFNLIIRDTLYGIRFRDLNSDLVKNFKGIERFPIDQSWDIKAKFEEYNPPKEIMVPNVLGQIDKEKSPGAVVFERDGQTYRIDAVDEGGDKLFLIIADQTSGDETYGGGRFMYVNKPDSTGTIDLDFNKAYNPPCVFTKYATCPLPPLQNYLKLRIEAGEKVYGEGH
ncbi:MAG TPA: DUF1684 domain-containing protein [Ignavibacteriaceae bacterium]|jgi:uncharacterized protein (DUF1684 family)|nr:MAG: hypothetical protein BWY38_01127 [Ignavibacteria bacterium ADurb.Bin266]OQY72755.1 MAG: hypothetical protein B6D44_09130 [Ignavibacteriales bacterium UTCHB2]HQF41911.1 DUF1684 domain-containing protein [Ignavibacteriaceae bacterium]HQI40678.1 DUF1684 domain-containing protein [Ignavibacteriaceae bacterium]HQJ45590.1 DUF1684 domain-containing protein [Ignavibacteriaceae bacterium]